MLYSCVQPVAWPSPPLRFSYSGLHEIETCPRRWALGNAEYPTIWQRHGYPGRVSEAALVGLVTHQAASVVTSRLGQMGCTSLRSANTVEAMKSLGGWTAVLKRCAEEILRHERDNPRVRSRLPGIRKTVLAEIPRMRHGLQRLIGRLKLAPRTGFAKVPSGQSARSEAIGQGTHTEVFVEAQDLSMAGRVDLLVLHDDRCDVIDFKTGEPTDDHASQLRLYALLWARDGLRNPSGRLVDGLRISYLSHDVVLPAPSSRELQHIELALRERIAEARSMLRETPPLAVPSAENCRFCFVRHLCSAYWDLHTQRRLRSDAVSGPQALDMQLGQVRRHGPSSWDGTIEVATALKPDHRVLLRSHHPDPTAADALNRSRRVRILDAWLPNPPSEGSTDIAVVSIGDKSEVFALPGCLCD